MGGEPFLALNIVSWPVDDLPLEMMGRVLQGGIDAAAKSGVAVLGGHTITDPEPKYGMVVLGEVEPARIVRNSTAREGDELFLTKPLGLGLISTAVKQGTATPELLTTAVDLMTTTNAAASAAMVRAGASAATDVTGFGLMGHLHKMLQACGLAATLTAQEVPLIAGALQLAKGGAVPGGTRRNHAYVEAGTDWGQLSEPEQLVMADAQTSGGLLIAASDPEAMAGALREAGVAFGRIGRVVAGRAGEMSVSGRLRE
jgi:selenide,water dikinase